MSDSAATLDLSAIGRELDIARQSRTTTGNDSTRQSDLETVLEDDSVSDSESAPSSSRLGAGNTSPQTSDDEDPRSPTCLLCFARPPSAVLLPCCHLNLCYLCAPLLLLKQCRSASPVSTAVPPTSPSRIPFNTALRKAMINHSKSRRLSGGNIAPPTEDQDHEVRAQYVLGVCNPEAKSELKGQQSHDGKIELAACEEKAPTRGKCLVCRAGVSGWLRVYTG